MTVGTDVGRWPVASASAVASATFAGLGSKLVLEGEIEMSLK